MNCENFLFSWYENHNFFNPIFRNALHLLLDDRDGLCGSLHSSEKLGSDSLKGRSLYNVSTCVLVWILFIIYFPACTRVWRHDNIFVRLFNFDNNPEKFKSIKLKVTINQHATVDSALRIRLTYDLNAFLGSFELIDALPIWISTIS